jgi:hypothetical protein
LLRAISRSVTGRSSVSGWRFRSSGQKHTEVFTGSAPATVWKSAMF